MLWSINCATLPFGDIQQGLSVWREGRVWHGFYQQEPLISVSFLGLPCCSVCRCEVRSPSSTTSELHWAWQSCCCPTAPAVMLLFLAWRKQNYVIWRVPVILKAVKDLPGSFCKVIQRHYFDMTTATGLKLLPTGSATKKRELLPSFQAQQIVCLLSPREGSPR